MVLGLKSLRESPNPSGMTSRSFESPPRAIAIACSFVFPASRSILKRAASRPVRTASEDAEPSWSRAEIVWTPMAFSTSLRLIWPMKLNNRIVKAREMMSWGVTSSRTSFLSRLAKRFI